MPFSLACHMQNKVFTQSFTYKYYSQWKEKIKILFKAEKLKIINMNLHFSN